MFLYDMALRSLLAFMEGTTAMLTADGLSEAEGHLRKATLEIEYAWGALAQELGASMIATEQQEEPRGSEDDMK